jgi:hypothetical protein
LLASRPDAVRGMDRHPNPAPPNRFEPRRRRDVELARKRGPVCPEGALDRQRPLAPAFGHAVGERSDSRSVDVADKLEHDGIGVARGVGDAEVEIEGEPSLIACVQLAQRRAALEDQRVKAASFVQIAQEQVLGNVDDRGVATVDSGTGWGAGRSNRPSA